MEVLGIDIGGSGIKGVPVNVETGALAGERNRIDTPIPAEPSAVAKVVAELVASFGWKGAVGCTMPSIVKNGTTLTAANIPPSWIGCNAEALFQSETGLPVKVLNDADAAGLGELYFGAAAGQQGTVLVLTFGTGVGSALFLDGKLVPNTELGHLRYAKNQIWEKYCADSVRKRESLKWDEWVLRVNAYLAHLELLFSPDLFIIGGGVANKTDKYWDKLVTKSAKVVPATLKNNAGIVGAALAAKDLA